MWEEKLVGAIASSLIEILPKVGKSIAKKDSLQKTVNLALGRLIKEFPVPESYRDTFRYFFSLEPVAQELSKLITFNEEPDFEELKSKLEKDGLDSRTLEGIDMSEVFDRFAEIFLEECAKNPDLRRLVEIRLENYKPYKSIYSLQKTLFKHYQEQFEYLPQPVRQMKNVVKIRLEDIFIPLSLMQEGKEVSEEIKRKIERIKRLQGKAPGREQKRELEAYTEILQTSSKESTKPITFKGLIKAGDKLVILGDPGAGKSTLLRYLALIYSQGREKIKETLGDDEVLFPIIVSINAYADALKKGQDPKGLNFIDFLTSYYRKQNLSGNMSRLFNLKLREGKCLVMFDGLDEVLDINQRKTIASAVKNFVNGHSKKGNKFIITSRIVGYNEAPLGNDFVHFKVLPFGKKEIRQFALKWYEAYKSPKNGVQPDIKEVKKETDAFIKDIKNTELEHLISNPLLLTIAALIREAGKKLPNRRVELYRSYVEAFAETWNRARDIYNFVVELKAGGKKIDETMVISTLSRVAFVIHSSTPGGVISQNKLKKILVGVFAKRYGLPLGDASTAAEEFISIMTHQIGLMVERELRAFGFIHQIFEEYLCARYLCLLREKERNKYVKRYLHHPRWEEPILLTLAYLQGENAEYLLEKIYKNKSKYEDILHRDLFLSAKALADDVDSPWSLIKKILDKTIKLWKSSPYSSQINEMEDIYYRMKGTKNEEYVEERIKSFLKDSNKKRRVRAAYFLINAKLSKDKAINTLAKLMEDKDPHIRFNAARALGTLGVKNKHVVDRLLKLTEDKDPHIRFNAARALGTLGVKNKHVVDRLLKLMEDKDPDIRFNATVALGNLGVKNKHVVDRLLKLTEDKNPGIRFNAAVALGLGVKNKHVVDRLLKLTEDKNPDIRSNAAVALGLGVKNKHVVDRLLKLTEDKDPDIRFNATVALGNLGVKNKHVVDRLLKLMEDKDPHIRFNATVALGNLGVKNKHVVDRLLKLTEDKNPDIRSNAAVTLVTLGVKNKHVVDRLLKLTEDKNPDIRSNATVALGLGVKNKHVVDRLLKLMEDKDPDIRFNATVALGNLGIKNKHVVDRLLKLTEDKDPHIRFNAAEALKSIGKYSKKTVDTLYNSLKISEDEDIFNLFRTVVGVSEEEKILPSDRIKQDEA